MVADEGYAPGWGSDALAMLGSRAAHSHAGEVLSLLTEGMTVLDVGCGPGRIPAGLAAAVGPSGRVIGIDGRLDQVTSAAGTGTTMGFVQASAYRLPVRTGAVDVAFAHALFEHLAEPAAALAELRRVLRPGGHVALVSSDWSAAVVEPRTPDVAAALAGHYLLRRRAGGDPFAGGRLAEQVAAAGFTSVRQVVHGRPDLAYQDLARYVGTRAAAAAEHADTTDRLVLRRAAAAAARWATRKGRFVQRWVEVTARAPALAGGDR